MVTVTKSTTPRLALAGLACVAALWAGAPASAQSPPQSAPQSAPQMPAPGVGASAPLMPAVPGPKLLSPAETRDSASMPGELRPEQPAKPQINIPLGRTPPVAATAASAAASRAQPGTKAGINDAVARCEAIVDETLRARCRADLAKQAPTR